MTNPQDQRAFMLLGQAGSAVTQCCELLGEQSCNQMLAQIDDATQAVRNRIAAGGHAWRS